MRSEVGRIIERQAQRRRRPESLRHSLGLAFDVTRTRRVKEPPTNRVPLCLNHGSPFVNRPRASNRPSSMNAFNDERRPIAPMKPRTFRAIAGGSRRARRPCGVPREATGPSEMPCGRLTFTIACGICGPHWKLRTSVSNRCAACSGRRPSPGTTPLRGVINVSERLNAARRAAAGCCRRLRPGCRERRRRSSP